MSRKRGLGQVGEGIMSLADQKQAYKPSRFGRAGYTTYRAPFLSNSDLYIFRRDTEGTDRVIP